MKELRIKIDLRKLLLKKCKSLSLPFRFTRLAQSLELCVNCVRYLPRLYTIVIKLYHIFMVLITETVLKRSGIKPRFLFFIFGIKKVKNSLKYWYFFFAHFYDRAIPNQVCFT